MSRLKHTTLRRGAALLLSASVLGACANGAATRLDDAAMADASAVMRAEIAGASEPITQDITLYEAMARALKSNLDHRVAMMEMDLARLDAGVARADMLPQIVASGGYYSRSNAPGASSRSLLSGRESLEPSTSTERDVWTGEIAAVWNVLDFGLASIRAQQLGNEALVIEERKRKAVIRIMEDVHAAYYRALSAERLTASLAALEGDVRRAYDGSRAQYEARTTAPMPALSYQRELTAIRAEAQALSRELKAARMELAALMGLSPDQTFRLSDPGRLPRPGRLAMDHGTMIETALLHRPEVRESVYARRIGEAEVKAAVLKALPGVEGFAGFNASSNDFLFNGDWADYGLRASWNVIDLFTTGKRKRRALAKVELERQRGLAAAMAVMSQVGVARMQYESLLQEYDTAQSAATVQGEITQQIEAQASAQRASQQTLVRERMNRILADARRDRLHAELARATAHLYTALGFDPYTAELTGTEDVQTISASLKTLWDARTRSPGR